MEDRRSNSALPAFLAALLTAMFFAASLTAYMGAYFWLGNPGYDAPGGRVVGRIYKHRSLYVFFIPASKVESLVQGRTVGVGYDQ